MQDILPRIPHGYRELEGAGPKGAAELAVLAALGAPADLAACFPGFIVNRAAGHRFVGDPHHEGRDIL